MRQGARYATGHELLAAVSLRGGIHPDHELLGARQAGESRCRASNALLQGEGMRTFVRVLECTVGGAPCATSLLEETDGCSEPGQRREDGTRQA